MRQARQAGLGQDRNDSIRDPIARARDANWRGRQSSLPLGALSSDGASRERLRRVPNYGLLYCATRMEMFGSHGDATVLQRPH